MSTPDPEPQGPGAQDPQVVRRTLTIVLGTFGVGLLLAIFWVSMEVRRVGQMEHVPLPEGSPRPGRPPTRTNSAPARAAATNGMVYIPGGTYRRGSENGAPDERPVREITVDGFWIDRHEVTNEEFERFVTETGYVTVAERKPEAAQYPDVPPEKLVPGAAVFHPPAGQVNLTDYLSWWEYVPGANWRHPEGPASSLHGLEKHPVVQVCWFDALRYAEWAGKRLPTEAEWEWAARGGLQGADFVWGDELRPGGRHMANIFQGTFPTVNRAEDGFRSTAPVGSFPPNGYGLLDMAGNVWEWCADWYRPDYFAGCPDRNPQGPTNSFDPDEPGVAKRVQRGGSFLCNEVYCNGYRPSTRMKASPDTGLCHSGFRCVVSLVAPAPTGQGRP